VSDTSDERAKRKVGGGKTRSFVMSKSIVLAVLAGVFDIEMARRRRRGPFLPSALPMPVPLPPRRGARGIKRDTAKRERGGGEGRGGTPQLLCRASGDSQTARRRHRHRHACVFSLSFAPSIALCTHGGWPRVSSFCVIDHGRFRRRVIYYRSLSRCGNKEDKVVEVEVEREREREREESMVFRNR